MNKKIFTTAVAALALGVSVGFAQDIHFSQWYSAPLNLNPSLAGAHRDLEISANYRDQWRAVAQPYKTYQVAANVRYQQKKWKSAFMGIGVNIFQDNAGDAQLKTMQASLSLAGHIRSGNSSFGLGLQGGYVQKSIDYSKLTWGAQYVNGSYDKANPNMETNAAAAAGGTGKFGYPDINVGANWQYGTKAKTMSSNDGMKASCGVTYMHVNTPRQSFYSTTADKLYGKMVGHAVIEIGMKNTNTVLLPNVIYQKQGPSQEILPGLLVKYIFKESSKYTGSVKGAAGTLGVQYRTKDAVVVMGMAEIANYAIGISYDINTSSLKDASSGRGGFELMLRYVNPNPFLYQSKASF